MKMRSDITECPWCAELMVEPTMLPCFHSFCLECLALCLCHRNSGESALCPLCGAMFQIPNDGVDSLPRNIFIQKLIEAKTSPTSTDSEKKCDICSGQGITNIAHEFCIECQQNMCVQCSQGHKFITSTKLHEVLTLEDQTETKLMLKLPENNHCEKHGEEKLKIYCTDCKAVVCTICFLHCHTKHGGSYIMEVVAEMKKKVITNIGEINVLSKKVHSELEKIDTEVEHLHAAVVKTEKQILEQGEEVKRWIDTHVQDFILKLRSGESLGVEMMKNIREDMILQKISFDSYTHYVTEVMQKGTPTYIASVAEELQTRAGDLKRWEVLSMKNQFEVTFKPSDMKEIVTSGTSIIGEITIPEHGIFGEFDIHDAFLFTSMQL